MLLKLRPRRRFAHPIGHLNLCSFCRDFKKEARPRASSNMSLVINCPVCDDCAAKLVLTVERRLG